jgi:hypothetical protein
LKNLKLFIVLVSTIFCSVSNPLPAKADLVTIGDVNIGDLDQWCKNYEGGSSSFAKELRLAQAVGICQINNVFDSAGQQNSYGVEKAISLDYICGEKYPQHRRLFDSRGNYDWQSQSCVAEVSENRGKGSSTIRTGGEDQNPQLKAVGTIGHDQLWSFCSSKGYRSYYDHGYDLQCGYQNWVQGQPEGDYFNYKDVCQQIYGTPYFATDWKACVAFF